MKNILFYFMLISFSVALASCEKDNNVKISNLEIEGYQFEAIVKGKGLDCGDTYLIDLKKLNGEAEIANGTYYADNLPPDLKVAGLKIRLNSRKPTNDELYACTTMGPGYSHLIVLDSKKVKK